MPFARLACSSGCDRIDMLTTGAASITADNSPATKSLLVIVSNGPLLIGTPDRVANRGARHVRIAPPPLPFPAMATTVATAVDPLKHGIVGTMMIDPDSVQPQIVTAANRRFPAIWTVGAHAGRKTIAIDWPATQGDPDLDGSLDTNAITDATQESGPPDQNLLTSMLAENATPQQVVAAQRIAARTDLVLSHATSAIQDMPDVLAVTIRTPKGGCKGSAYAHQMADRIETLVGTVPTDAAVVLVHLTDSAESSEPGSGMLYTMTLLSDHDLQLPVRTRLPFVGGFIQQIAGLAPPLGAAVPEWGPGGIPASRPLPVQAREDDCDWEQIVAHVLAMDPDGADAKTRTRMMHILTVRFRTLGREAIGQRNWSELAKFGRWLTQLSDNSGSRWWVVLACQRLDQIEDLKAAVAGLEESFPDLPITKIASSLLCIDDDPDTARELLESIDIETVRLTSALGTLGRMSIRAGLNDQGAQAIERAIQSGETIPIDRVMLATHYFQRGDAQAALAAMGMLGQHNGTKHWSLLRLQILLALDRMEDATDLVESFASRFPGNPEAGELLQDSSDRH